MNFKFTERNSIQTLLFIKLMCTLFFTYVCKKIIVYKIYTDKRTELKTELM